MFQAVDIMFRQTKTKPILILNLKLKELKSYKTIVELSIKYSN
jgi:hypothetical protein